MLTVNQVRQLTGVSIRTLHYYDTIGLLKPTATTEAGYRLYDDAALRRLQMILLFRELRFPLKEIREILDSPSFDMADALRKQIRLLELQKARTEKMISLAHNILDKGVMTMDFTAFDRTELNRHTAEARERWGHTDAYNEYADRLERESEMVVGAHLAQLMQHLADIGALQDLPPQDAAVQDKVRGLQEFMTQHFYTCTTEVLAGLGEMYVSDSRMQSNIDRECGDGTAAFVSKAIAAYCARGAETD